MVDTDDSAGDDARTETGGRLVVDSRRRDDLGPNPNLRVTVVRFLGRVAFFLLAEDVVALVLALLISIRSMNLRLSTSPRMKFSWYHPSSSRVNPHRLSCRV